MKYRLFDGNYLFHLHTPLTDGKITINEYFEYASFNNIESLVFLEHIRRQPSYCVRDFVAQVRACEREFGIRAKIGFEAKLLPDGALDIGSDDIEQAEVIGIAEHAFPNDFALFRTSFFSVIRSYRYLLDHKELVWVHPGLWFKKNNPAMLKQSDYLEMLLYAQGQGIKVERNLRYNLVPSDILEKLSPSNVVTGADAHRMDDLKKWLDTKSRAEIALPRP